MIDSGTIAAIATPVGEGGIGVIRVSGDAPRRWRNGYSVNPADLQSMWPASIHIRSITGKS